jgi:hypothetical protein
MSCISDNQYDSIKITNQQIIAFYQSNPHINFESINLSIIEILRQFRNGQDNSIPAIPVFPDIKHIEPIATADQQKIKELDSFLSNASESIRTLIATINRKYINAKSEYIRDFRSAAAETEPKELFEKTNQTFFEMACSLLSATISIKFSNISDKTKIILQQFNKILTANTEQIFYKPEKSTFSSKIDEYLHNFESNSAHMIQAITQLLSECLAVFELRAKKAIELINGREDPSFAVYYKLIYELNDLLHQLPKSTGDGERFDNVLSQQFPTASVGRDSETEYLLQRENKPAIYIETYDIREHNIGTSDVKRFLKRTIERSTNGILISQYTGITSKPNFHIEIHNNIVVVYLHKLATSPENIQIAAVMVDSISNKMTDFCSISDNKYSIPKDILDDVNREYQQFILQKEMIITVFKEQQKTLLSKLDEMRFGSLDKYLSTRYSTSKKQGYNCDLCNHFNVGTLKGLAAHKRGCARKIQREGVTSTELADNYDMEKLSK